MERVKQNVVLESDKICYINVVCVIFEESSCVSTMLECPHRCLWTLFFHPILMLLLEL